MKVRVFLAVMLPVFTVLLIGGCATTTTPTILSDDFDAELLKKMKTWEGSHISQLIQRIGPPTYKSSDEAGGTIYIWQIDPAALPPLSDYSPLYPPSTQTSPRSMMSALSQATSLFLYREAVRKRIHHQNQRMKVQQKILAMKRMFYVRSDGTIYHAQLLYQ